MGQLLDRYRTFRHLLMTDFCPLTAYPRGPDEWEVVQFVHRKTAKAVTLACRVRGDQRARTTYPGSIHPSDLDTAKTYRVVDPFSARKPKMATGEMLLAEGLRIPLHPESAATQHLHPTE